MRKTFRRGRGGAGGRTRPAATKRSCIAFLVPGAAAVLAACEGVQSSLDPGGPQAALIARETWYLVAMATIVFVVVAGALLAALLRRRREGAATSEARLAAVVGGALVLTLLVLLANLAIDMSVERALQRLSADGAVTIEITGHQWWWEVEYANDDPSRRLTTANEIHVPAGEPVLVSLRSADVIHSFWIPSLHGKRDAIPGYTRSLWIQADGPGVFRGACAEFCGHQHAYMALVVIAEPRAEFERWYEAQLAPGAPPEDPRAEEGARVFLGKSCPTCHTVRGTAAGGRVGPDLTHIASRSTLAAATLQNDAASLRAWIADPHAIKPGVRMPTPALTPAEVDAVGAYLRSLP